MTAAFLRFLGRQGMAIGLGVIQYSEKFECVRVILYAG